MDPWLCIESGPQGIAAAGPAPVDHSMELQPSPLGSKVVHRVPARRGLLLLARSALITRWESNQVPMGSRVVHHAGA